MPSFTFTSPEGKSYTVNGPDGATQEQAFQILQGQLSAAPKEKTWGEVGVSAIKNTPKSLGNMIGGIANAVMHPIDTGKNVLDVLAGGLQNALPKGVSDLINKGNDWLGPENRRSADIAQQKATQVGHFYKDRYGSIPGFKNALAEDPAGVLSDASTVLTLGGGAISKVPKLGGVGNALVSTGNSINPVNMLAKGVSKAAPAIGNVASKVIGDLGTRTGGDSIKAAYKAGSEGGTKGEAFANAMRGTSDAADVVDTAKQALLNIRKERGVAYKASMGNIASDKTVLDFTPIEKATNDALNISTFKGKSINRSAGDVQQKLVDVINEWKTESPKEFHTAEGLDALKQTIGDIRDSTQYGTPARVAADRVYNAVKNQIVTQAPEYANAMKDYEKTSGIIKDIEKSLSLGDKAAIDTSLRKLQSVTRNNANTNYGNRLNLAQLLEAHGASELLPALYGQSLNSFAPRGLNSLISSGAAGYGVATLNPAVLPVIAATSPRLMGEASYAAGKVGGSASRGAKAANNALATRGINPAISANYLYQLNQANQEQR